MPEIRYKNLKGTVKAGLGVCFDGSTYLSLENVTPYWKKKAIAVSARAARQAKILGVEWIVAWGRKVRVSKVLEYPVQQLNNTPEGHYVPLTEWKPLKEV